MIKVLKVGIKGNKTCVLLETTFLRWEASVVRKSMSVFQKKVYLMHLLMTKKYRRKVIMKVIQTAQDV